MANVFLEIAFIWVRKSEVWRSLAFAHVDNLMVRFYSHSLIRRFYIDSVDPVHLDGQGDGFGVQDSLFNILFSFHNLVRKINK